jgi:hypothetical protein
MRVGPRLAKWLTAPESDPSVRVRFWTEVEGRPPTDSRVRAAQRAIGKTGWAAYILSAQFPDGHWVTPKSTGRDLYLPKYTVTNWMAIILADLGMTRRDPRIRRTAEIILDRWSKPGWPLNPKKSDREVCIVGNAVRTLIRFGYLDDPSVQRGIAVILRIQKSDGGWHCFPSKSGTLDGWEGLAALAEIPEDARDEAVRGSIERGAEFYLKRHLMDEGPARYPPWFRIHYPNHYYYDLLVGLRILTRLGYGRDHRLAPAVRWLQERRRSDGKWWLDASNPEIDWKMDGGTPPPGRVFYPVQLEPLNLPSRWATVEALSVLARTGAR